MWFLEQEKIKNSVGLFQSDSVFCDLFQFVVLCALNFPRLKGLLTLDFLRCPLRERYRLLGPRLLLFTCLGSNACRIFEMLYDQHCKEGETLGGRKAKVQ